MAGRGRKARYPKARCPEGHRDAVVTVERTRQAGGSQRRVCRCRPAEGAPHFFTAVVADEHPVLAPVHQPPPSCPLGHDGRVVRNGYYGRRVAVPRQRYRCYPDPEDLETFHSFTPPLARQHVHSDGEQCRACEELRGVHRGEPTVARTHSWPARTVAEALRLMANGGSYAEVSRWALRTDAAEAARSAAGRKGGKVGELLDGKAHDDDGEDGEEPKLRERPLRGNVEGARTVVFKDGKERRHSRASVEARNVWHIAADWCEVFAPVVWAPLEQKLRTEALADRARLDALKAAGEPLVRPQVLLIDDAPTYGREEGAANRRRRDKGFFLLVAGEVQWTDLDPFDSLQLPVPMTRLRLVRALPKSNTPAWRLVFDELGYAPDFVVSDASTAQIAATQVHYPGTVFVPSVWHIGNALRGALRDVGRAWTTTPAGRALDADLNRHLERLRRGDPAMSDEAGHRAWWGDLLAMARSKGLPTDKFASRRKKYEDRVIAALPALVAHPEVPISTGGLETLHAKAIGPILAGRRAVFANIERTNSLLDLAVAARHGALDDTHEVAQLLRADALAADGHAAPLRAVSDPRGASGRYSSLRDATLLSDLATTRGLL